MKLTSACITAATWLLVASAHAQAPGPGAAPGGFAAFKPPAAAPISFDEGPDLTALFGVEMSDKAPKPSADPRNFEGVWQHRETLQGRIAKTMTGGRIPYTDEAKKILTYRNQMELKGQPVTNASAKCLPPGQTWQLDLNFPFQIVQRKSLTYFVFHEFHGRWDVRMNQQPNPAETPAYMGRSVGHWDGNTLVIETSKFKDDMWLEPAGTPMSKDAHVTYRVRKIDDGQALEIVTTINDLKLYTKPWSLVRVFGWRPDKTMMAEYNCEQQVGTKGGAEAYGIVEDTGATK